MTFEEMNLSFELMSGLNDVNFDKLTELQQSVIPLVLEGKDALIKAGSGKDDMRSFIIPSLEKLIRNKKKEGARILIVTPHSDDAREIEEMIWAIGYHAQIQCATVGLNGDWDEQKQALLNGIPAIVANPGRLLEIMQKNRFVFRDLELLVLDKADEMASLGLFPKVDDITKRIITGHQTLVYSREFNEEIKNLAGRELNEPTIIGFENLGSNGRLTGEPPVLSGRLKQGYIKVPHRMKITTLMAHIDSTPADTCVIFTASKRGTDRIYRVLRKKGYSTTSLHGKLSEDKRTQRFANFANGDIRFLLVSDISAADLELEKITQVINYDVPNDPDEYRYRAGLVGKGKAARMVSLVSKQDRSDINQLKNELGEAPDELPLPDEVKKKMKQRQTNRSPGRGKVKKGKGRGHGNGRKKREKKDELKLPRPSYDKLSGGRSGKKDDSGVIKFFKKLFS